jgi:DNA-directed RNA polymerase subunit H (RpoH/RPB5)
MTGTHHRLVPKHEKLSEKEKNALYDRYKLQFRYLPKINLTDAAIQHLDVKEGDVIRIIRFSPTAGESLFYRGVGKE